MKNFSLKNYETVNLTSCFFGEIDSVISSLYFNSQSSAGSD